MAQIWCVKFLPGSRKLSDYDDILEMSLASIYHIEAFILFIKKGESK